MLFLGTFTELREATISYVICVILLSFGMEQLGYQWMNFNEVWYLRIFQKSIKFKCNALIWRGLGFTSDTLWDINIPVALGVRNVDILINGRNLPSVSKY